MQVIRGMIPPVSGASHASFLAIASAKGFEKLAFRVGGRSKWFLTNLEPDKARAILIDRFPPVALEAPAES